MGGACGSGDTVQRIERLLRAIDRFQQRHAVLAFPVGVVKKFGESPCSATPSPTTRRCSSA
jgi:hypothetical protein